MTRCRAPWPHREPRENGPGPSRPPEGHTANDRPNNDFDDGNFVLRLDRDLSSIVSIGATLRGFEGKYGDPGDIYTNDPYAYETESNWIGTVFADFRLAPDWTAHVIVGGQDRRYLSFDESPGSLQRHDRRAEPAGRP